MSKLSEILGEMLALGVMLTVLYALPPIWQGVIAVLIVLLVLAAHERRT